jgi:hypothetical protein
VNREQALRAMLEGAVVECEYPIYLTRKIHGGGIKFRWNKDLMCIEYKYRLVDWKHSRSSFYLCSEFYQVKE